MPRKLASECHTVQEVEHELAVALADLRRIDKEEPGNVQARGSAEYRVGVLRRRKQALEMAA